MYILQHANDVQIFDIVTKKVSLKSVHESPIVSAINSGSFENSFQCTSANNATRIRSASAKWVFFQICLSWFGLGNFFESLSGDEHEVIENTTLTSNFNEKVKLVTKNWADGMDEEESLSAIDDEHVRPLGNQDVLLKLD